MGTGKKDKAIGEALFEDEGDSRKGMFLVFQLENEMYGVEIRHVSEIVGIQEIAAYPAESPYIKGIVNLRGKGIQVMDLRSRFNFPSNDYDADSCIILLDIGGRNMGIAVDRVKEVIRVQESEIEPLNGNRRHVGAKYVIGMAKTGDKCKTLLDASILLDVGPLEQANTGSGKIALF